MSNCINTKKWDDNYAILTQSKLSKIHRRIMLKRSMFHQLVTDRNAKILDVGCGLGTSLAYFAAKGFCDLYGIEPDAELAKAVPSSIAQVKICKAEHIDFDNDAFDVVFVYGVFHHLRGGFASWGAACSEIYRVLKPDGLLFVMEPGKHWVFRLVEVTSKILGTFFGTFRLFVACLEEEKPELFFFLKHHNTLRSYLAQRGFRILVDRYSTYIWVFTGRKRPC